MTWLTEEQREQHQERLNQTRASVVFEPGDMVMARVQVQSKASTGAVGKFANKSIGPFCITKWHNNGSYSVQPFDKPDAATWKFV